MKVVIRNKQGQYLRRISPDGTPHFSHAPLDAWQWGWSEEEVSSQLKLIQEQFGMEWTAEAVLKATK